MSKFVVAALFAGLFMVQGVWAACTADLDMQGYGINNLKMSDGDSVPSDAATVEYIKAVAQKRGDGLTLSQSTGTDLTWLEAIQYCNNLESYALSNAGEVLEHTKHNDWRLPTLEDWSNACYVQGATTEVHVLEDIENYFERNEHPERTWKPAGVCGVTSPDTTFWWVNRHTAEKPEGDYVPFEKNSGLLDAVYKAAPPEADDVVRNVKYGRPWVWNPSTSKAELKQVRGNETFSARCIR